MRNRAALALSCSHCLRSARFAVASFDGAKIARHALLSDTFTDNCVICRWHEMCFGVSIHLEKETNMSNVPYRVVVGTDFSETAELALKSAFEFAAQHERGEVHVINAVQYLGAFVQMDLPDATAYRLPLDEAQERLEAHVGAALSTWQEETKKTISRCATY